MTLTTTLKLTLTLTLTLALTLTLTLALTLTQRGARQRAVMAAGIRHGRRQRCVAGGGFAATDGLCLQPPVQDRFIA